MARMRSFLPHPRFEVRTNSPFRDAWACLEDAYAIFQGIFWPAYMVCEAFAAMD